MGAGAALVACVQSTGQKVPQASAKTCVECHPEMKDQFSSGHVHAPVKEEKCSACHLPHGLVGGLFFREDEPGMCLSCHRNMKAKPDDASSHDPEGAGKCSNCHTPHNSPYPALLKNSPDQDCLSCHDRSGFRKKIIHAPVNKGCKTCHDPHRSAHPALLIEEPDALCRSCHQVKQPAFRRAHANYPVTSDCLSCHNPHSSDQKGLLRISNHAPMLEKKCDRCHRQDTRKISLRKKVNALCLDCHQGPQEKTDQTVHPPYRESKCSLCHRPHASASDHLLTEPPKNLCGSCHSESSLLRSDGFVPGTPQKEEDNRQEKPSPDTAPTLLSRHQPVEKGECLACHSGHATTRPALLIKERKELCLDCHGEKEYAKDSSSHRPARGKSCDTCHQPHGSSHRALLAADEQVLCFSCHTRESNQRGRFSLHRPFASGNCSGCHALHKDETGHLLKQPVRKGLLCNSCHQDIVAPTENIKTHQPVAQGECIRCHAPHAADYSGVMRDRTGRICLGCHTDIDRLITSSKIRHKPVIDGNCSACHVAHGSPHDTILRKGQPMLCLSCHKEVAQFWRKGSAHEPAMKNCMTCHEPHGSDQDGLLEKTAETLCGQCHRQDGTAFAAAHGGIVAKGDSCLQCHDPHGGPDKSLLYPVGHQPFLKGDCAPCHKGGKK